MSETIEKTAADPKATPMKKITFRDLLRECGFESVKAFFKQAKEDGNETAEGLVFLGRVYGEASRSRVASTQYGDSVYFLGKIKAVMFDGSSFWSNKVFLPEYVSTEIESGLHEGNGRAAQFAFDIFLKTRSDLKIGYEFIAKSLFDIADPFAAMEQSLPPMDAEVLALPSPDANSDTNSDSKSDSAASGKKSKAK